MRDSMMEKRRATMASAIAVEKGKCGLWGFANPGAGGPRELPGDPAGSVWGFEKRPVPLADSPVERIKRFDISACDR